MKSKFNTVLLAAVFAGCATQPLPQTTRVPAGIVVGKVRTISFSGLTDSKPLIVVGSAYVTISEPASLKGKDVMVGSSEDYPFKIGDEVEFDFTDGGLEKAADGTLRTEMLYRIPIKVRPNKVPEPTSGGVTPRAASSAEPTEAKDARVAAPPPVAHR